MRGSGRNHVQLQGTADSARTPGSVRLTEPSRLHSNANIVCLVARIMTRGA